MLSYTTGKHGRGWVYAVNTALDGTGATTRVDPVDEVRSTKGGSHELGERLASVCP